uniref:hypothetical protein n=1 Tax=Sulfuriferula sp. GW6 TaxID=3345112 RepID=UPI0039F7045E
MRKLKTIVAALVPVFLASCATTTPPATKPTPTLGRYQFEYTATDRRAVALIQVFDDGTNTYLQFNRLSMPIVITANDGAAPLPYTRQGLYLTVPGVYATLKVATRGHETQIANKAKPAGVFTPPASPDAAAVAIPSVPQAAASTAPAAALQPPVTASAPAVVESRPIRAVASPVLAPEREEGPSMFRVPFTGDSLTVGTKAQTVLDSAAPIALSAPAITLYGRAIKGETEDLAVAQELALRRAWIVMANLVHRGADPDKFRLFYSGKKGVNAVEIAIPTTRHKV